MTQTRSNLNLLISTYAIDRLIQKPRSLYNRETLGTNMLHTARSALNNDFEIFYL